MSASRRPPNSALMDVELAGGDGDAVEGEAAGVAAVVGEADEACAVEDGVVGFGGEVESPDEVGAEVVGVESGVALLER